MSDSTSTAAASTVRSPRRLPRYLAISAWSVPVLVLGQFAMLAILPVVLLVIGALRSTKNVAVRVSIGALAALYATPLVIWALRSDPAQSLSKDISPVFVGLIVAAAAAVILSVHTVRKRA